MKVVTRDGDGWEAYREDEGGSMRRPHVPALRRVRRVQSRDGKGSRWEKLEWRELGRGKAARRVGVG